MDKNTFCDVRDVERDARRSGVWLTARDAPSSSRIPLNTLQNTSEVNRRTSSDSNRLPIPQQNQAFTREVTVPKREIVGENSLETIPKWARKKRGTKIRPWQNPAISTGQSAQNSQELLLEKPIEQNTTRETVPSEKPKKARSLSAESTETPEVVGIAPILFPREKVLTEHIGAIQRAVLSALSQSPDPLPRLTFGAVVHGALRVHCECKKSSEWLSRVMARYKIAGQRFTVLPERDLPGTIKMEWKTRIVGVQDTRTLLPVLQRLNPGIHTNKWRLNKVSVSESSTRRIISVDLASAAAIREYGYRLHTGIDLSSFRIVDKSRETSPRE